MSSGRNKNQLSKIIILWLLKMLWRLLKWAVLKVFVRMFPNWQSRPPSEEALQDFYKSIRWSRLSRWARDKYGDQCMKCKKNSTAYPRLRIVTDHIKPVRTNWWQRWDKDNLQRLCDGCNRAKGSHDTTDYRNYRPIARWAAPRKSSNPLTDAIPSRRFGIVPTYRYPSGSIR